MNKNKKEEQLIFNEILIRSVDCSLLYNKIKNNDLIEEYERLKFEIARLKDKQDQDVEQLEQRREELSKQIFSFDGKNIVWDNADTRFVYTGTISDSLMSRKLRQVVKDDKGAIRNYGASDTSSGTDFTDIIINLKFKYDIMVQCGTTKKVYNQETKAIEETNEKKSKKLISKKKLRKMAYEDGVIINGIHYVNFQRSSSKARTGNDLFIDERYFKEMNEWQNMGIPFGKMVKSKDRENPNPFESADLVSSRSYTSLTSSSIIGTLNIDPYSILLIDDVKGEYTMDCNVIETEIDENGKKHLKTTKKPYTQRTDLWDGQSLCDVSIFNEGKYYTRNNNGKIIENTYKGKGFLLLRNHLFKTAVFNTNLHKYYQERFKGMENPVLTDTFGEQFEIDKVKIVTTRNSCKIFKFADAICAYLVDEEDKVQLRQLEEKSNDKAIKKEKERLTWNWYRAKLKTDNELFGVCKYEKTSKFGDKQQLWYQVLGSLNLNKEQLWKIAEPQVKEVNLMKKHVAFFKRGLDLRAKKNAKETMMLQLLEINENISRTRWYVDYRRSQLASVLKRLYAGKIQIPNSDFCVLVANPYEMLRASVGDTIKDSILHDYEVYNSRYADGEELYGFRSPHICTGNCALLNNTYKTEVVEWFNFTDRILVINLWGKGAFLSPIWNGCDTDSDTVYLGNEPTILGAVKETFGKYLVPINGLFPKAKMMEYTNENMAIVDGQLCNDFIGKICNLARDLQSFYWHLYNAGTEENKNKYLSMIYDDICILEVLSNIAIDSAKRRYDIDIAGEIKRMKDRPYLRKEGIILADDSLMVMEKRYKRSLSEKTVDEYKKLVELRNKATDEITVEEINSEIEDLLTTTNTYIMRSHFTKGLKSKPKKKKKNSFLDEEERELYIKKQKAYAEEQRQLTEKIYRKLQSPMDLLAEVIKENLERADRTNFIEFVEVIKPIPKGVKADYNRIAAIKEICLSGIRELNRVQKNFDGNTLSFDEMYDEKKNIEKNIIHDLKYNRGKERTITTWDIHKLIRDVYDIRPKRNSKGNAIKDKDGKIVWVDKRDIDLIDARVGSLLLQWVYTAFPNEFIGAIRDNKGERSYIVEVDFDSESHQKLLKNEPIYELDGHYYKICYKSIKTA